MSRTARVEMRLAPAVHAMLRRAAEIQGRSVSDFVVTAAQEAAKKAIADMEIITLCVEDQEQFAKRLLNPPPPSPGLRKAFKRYKSLVRE